MSDPRELHVIGKKSEVADRTLNERKFCAIDDYYYSEMFTCPICYGRKLEHDRIIDIIENDTDMEINSGKMVFSESGERVTPERLVKFLSVGNAN